MRVLAAVLLTLLVGIGGGCQPAARNPQALWINFFQSELNLVLVDHEPPPF